MRNKLEILALVIIFLIAFILRFNMLGEIPYGFYQDESAIGYNAFSIIETGKDEYGQTMPLYFKSFGDYKLPVYIYVTIPSIMLFGMTEFAVRFPSAFFGFLTVIVFYVFIKKSSNNEKLSLIATGLLAINPWHLHYNRATFEVSISLFLFVLGGFLLLLAFTKKRTGFFLIGTLCFIISFYSYNLTRLLAPALWGLFLVYFRKDRGFIRKKEVIITAITSVIFLIPFILTFFQQGGVSSAGGTLIFSSARVQAPLLELRSYVVPLPDVFGKIFFNTFLLTAWQYLIHIASYFSVTAFFISGSEHGNHGIGNFGQFYLIELPFFLIGIYTVLKSKMLFGYFLFGWAAVVIAVASLTREAPHMTRSFFLILPTVTVIAIGVQEFLKYSFNKKNWGMFLLCVVGLLGLLNIVYYLTSYYVRFPKLYASSWRSADKDVALFIKQNEKKYDRVIFDSQAGFMYSSLLFYTHYSPTNFQRTVKRLPDDSEGFSTVQSFGKYEFREIDWSKDIQSKKTLIISRHDRKPDNVPPLMTFYYPMRPVAFAVGQNIVSYPIEEIAYVAVETQ